MCESMFRSTHQLDCRKTSKAHLLAGMIAAGVSDHLLHRCRTGSRGEVTLYITRQAEDPMRDTVGLRIWSVCVGYSRRTHSSHLCEQAATAPERKGLVNDGLRVLTRLQRPSSA